MNLSEIRKVEHGFLRSKVARRIFLLFILCALLPLSALAYFSFNQITKQLQLQASQRLHEASKAAGMTIIERLTFLETDMKVIIERLQTRPDSLESATHGFRERIKDRFKGISLVSGNGGIIVSKGTMSVLPQLSKDEQKHINEGKTLVMVRRGKDTYPGVFIARALDPDQSDQEILFGEIQPTYLWGGEGFLSPTMVLSVFDQSNNILFSSFPEHVPSQEFEHAVRVAPASGHFTWTHEGATYLADYWTIFMIPTFYDKWVLTLSQSETDILEPIRNFEKIFLLVVILTFLVVLFLSIGQIRKSLVPIELLQRATRRVAAKDFGTKVKIASNDEFEELGESFNAMAGSLENHLMVMTTLNHIGIALSAEKDTHRLLELITLGAKSVTRADACSLYTITEDRKLKLAVMRIDSLNLVMDSGGDESIPLFDAIGNPNTSIVAAYSVLNDKTTNIPNIYAAEGFDFSGNRDLDRKTGYHSLSVLSVPMKNHENEIIGVLELTNAKDNDSQEFVPFSDEDQRLAETLASQAAVALTKNTLIDGLKKLFDSLIELIATAIDDKSPYTGGHCRRVPDLTMMLAEAVCNKKNGIFRDFTMSEEEMYELKVAALLHDCGKVSTPVHIVDKATKLETISDRIDLIDTRFEILKRDLQIALLRKKLAPVKEEDELDSSELEIDMIIQQIQKDREFVRACNKRDISLDEKLRDRLIEIADKYKWANAKGEEESIISEDELYMLINAEGTLTPEEREMINQHVSTSIKMLEKLPYPKSLRNVPEFAGAHHERMDGKGYPKGLTGDQIPMQGRILAIADVFEALTAKDRPYKKGNTLMEALRILGSMKKEGRIDPDLFDVFINEKVYLRYAEAYLSPEQIDEVVLSEIPGYTPPQ